jgi:hypothetical protein
MKISYPFTAFNTFLADLQEVPRFSMLNESVIFLDATDQNYQEVR